MPRIIVTKNLKVFKSFAKRHEHKFVLSTNSPELAFSTLNSRNPILEYKKHIWRPLLMFFSRRLFP